MKLIIRRDQPKGFFGGTKFLVEARVELTPEEKALIEKYKLDDEPLFEKESKVGILTMSPTVKKLVKGISFKIPNLNLILDYEEGIKSACKNLKSYLEVAKTFDGGEEVIEF